MNRQPIRGGADLRSPLEQRALSIFFFGVLSILDAVQKTLMSECNVKVGLER
jgi:hypothetical protein